MIATPLEISIALHYWTSPGDYGVGPRSHDNFDAPAVVIQRSDMVAAGLLERSTQVGDGRVYKAGPALKTYIDALCAIPWPVQTWVIPDALSNGQGGSNV